MAAGHRAGLQPAALAPALVGLAISVYLTVEHYTAGTTLACPRTSTFNCEKVTTSSYAHILGVPVAVLGLAYFVTLAVLLLPPLGLRPGLDALRLAVTATGVAMVLYLVCVELFALDAICLWCTGVHVCAVAVFLAVLWRALAPATD